MAPLHIMFMGTASFAVPSLVRLAENGYTISAVVTGPDMPRGRGRRMSPTPVKEMADRRGLPVMQPERVRSVPLLPILSLSSHSGYSPPKSSGPPASVRSTFTPRFSRGIAALRRSTVPS
jgi:hypothetical protein